MSGLIIKLRPHEQVMINGVIIENGGRQSRLRVITENARIMRMRDTIDPAKATTPLKRAHYLAQRVIFGDLAAAEASAQIRQAIANSASVLGQDTASEVLLFVDQCIADNDFYRAMQYLRTKTVRADKP